MYGCLINTVPTSIVPIFESFVSVAEVTDEKSGFNKAYRSPFGIKHVNGRSSLVYRSEEGISWREALARKNTANISGSFNEISSYIKSR